MKVNFYDHVADERLKFAVIISQYQGKWVFCRHRDRATYEIPGGHRENGESILETAKRELYEETGALEYQLEAICVYSVIGATRVNPGGEESFGMLYFADIQAFESELHSEIASIALFDTLPHAWTYPLIQPLLMQEYLRRKS